MHLLQLARQVEHRKLAVQPVLQVEHEAVDHQVLKFQQLVAQFQVDVQQLQVAVHLVVHLVVHLAAVAQVAVHLIIQHYRLPD